MFLDRIPIKLRLSLGYAVWMAILFGGIGVGVYRFVEHNLYQSVDAALLTSAKSIRDARFTKGFNSPLMEDFLEEFLGEKFIKPYAQLVDLSGRVSLKTPSMRVNLPVTPQAVARAERGEPTYETFVRRGRSKIRQVTIPVIKRGRFSRELIQVGAPLDATVQTLNSISLMLWASLPAGLCLSIFFGYLLTSRSLRPVRELTDAASQLKADDMTMRLPLPSAKDEIRDLTCRFNEMTDRLDDAFSRLRRFAGDVSHELRTPLTVLRGEAELSLRKERTPEEYQRALQTIVKESVNMTDIVEELLLLARAQGNSLTLQWEELRVSDLVAELKDTFDSALNKKKIDLRINDATNEASLLGSRSYLFLSLKNILQNAVKHSGCDATIWLNVSQNSEFTYFTIKDEGEGIPKESLPYIFDPFYRADTARNRKAGGTGIGLSLVQALVKLHEGKIWVDSVAGKGASFTIKIPRNPKSSIDNRGSSIQSGSSQSVVEGWKKSHSFTKPEPQV